MHLRNFEALSEAADLQSLADALAHITYELDFERFSLTAWGAPQVTGGKPPIRSVANPPDSFRLDTLSYELAQQDPVYQHLTHSTRPITFDQDTYQAANASDLWDAQAPHGYCTGIAAALNLGGPRLAFGFDRTSRLPTDPGRIAHLVSQITTVLTYAQDSHALLLGKANTSPGLSPQQARILHLIAQGKSDNVIAEILGVSAHTVNHHVRKLFAKLGVSTRTQAVNVANSFRLL